MHKHSTLRAVYKELFTWLGKPDLYKPAKRNLLEYSDVFPLIYLKVNLEGPGETQRRVKHLLIDEMQDHSLVQYAVISRIFRCKKTILGDARQSIIPFGSATAEQINRVFRQAECVRLCKSYRSSWEISQFAQHVSPDPDLVAIQRHGERPHVLSFEKEDDALQHILQETIEFAESEHRTLGIICKTTNQANLFHQFLLAHKTGAVLLSSQSNAFTRGVMLCSVHLAKGLEFDRVIVPDASARNYLTEMDRNLLYVACTRAMHRLTLTHTGKVSPFLPSEW